MQIKATVFTDELGKRKVLFPLLLLVFITSCSNNFRINRPDEAGYLTFSRTLIIGYKRFSPCVRWLNVYDISHLERIVWRLNSVNTVCHEIEKIKIGVVPEGFKAEGSPPELGHEIRVTVEDNNDVYGASEPFVYLEYPR